MVNDTSLQPSEDSVGEIAETHGTIAADIANASAESVVEVSEATEEVNQTPAIGRFTRWERVATEKLKWLFTRAAKSTPKSGDSEHSATNRLPKAALGKLRTRCLRFLMTHQKLCALLLVAGVAVGVFATGPISPRDGQVKSSSDDTPLTFDEIEVHPPGTATPRETAHIPQFDQARPIINAEHDSDARFGGATIADGSSFTAPRQGATAKRRAGRSAWLKGTIEDVTSNPPGVRQIGHVDLPASKSSASRR